MSEEGAIGLLRRRSNFRGLSMKVLVEDQVPYVMFRPHEIPEKPALPPGMTPERQFYDIGSLNGAYGMFLEVKKAFKLIWSQFNYRRFCRCWRRN